MSIFSVTPEPTMETVDITAKQGRRWEYFVPQGLEIAYSFHWFTGHTLQLRLIPQQSFQNWLRNPTTRVDVWAHIFGTGRIQGSVVPPSGGGWVLLLEATPAQIIKEPISVTASSVVRPITKQFQ